MSDLHSNYIALTCEKEALHLELEEINRVNDALVIAIMAKMEELANIPHPPPPSACLQVPFLASTFFPAHLYLPFPFTEDSPIIRT